MPARKRRGELVALAASNAHLPTDTELVSLPHPCSADVQLAAINALYNSLEFVRENFGREVSSAAAQAWFWS